MRGLIEELHDEAGVGCPALYRAIMQDREKAQMTLCRTHRKFHGQCSPDPLDPPPQWIGACALVLAGALIGFLAAMLLGATR